MKGISGTGIRRAGRHLIIYWQKFCSILWFFWNWICSSSVLNKVRDQSIIHNIFKIQDNESIICGVYCVAFMEYMLLEKNLLDYSYFSPNDYKKNGKIICEYFKDNYGRRSESRV